MSKYTYEYLADNIGRGFTAKRGNAWWAHMDKYRVDSKGESNHYDGAIPLDDIKRRWFGFEVKPQPLYLPIPADLALAGYVDPAFDADGNPAGDWWKGDDSELPPIPIAGMRLITDSVAWCRDDNLDLMGIHSSGYFGHQYADWLVNKVESILGDLQVANVGLLAHGAQAYVQLELPDNVEVDGTRVNVRPFLMATTSFDGSLATVYKLGYTDVVCDNTREMFLSESGQVYKRKHTRNSEFDSLQATEALSIVHRLTDDIIKEITALTAIDVSDKEWAGFVEAHAPVTAPDGKPELSQRAVSLAEKKRETLTKMWNVDTRVAPWKGTAWGVVQAVNTYVHHEQTVRNMSRFERNLTRAVEGGIGEVDKATLATLGNVMGRELVKAG